MYDASLLSSLFHKPTESSRNEPSSRYLIPDSILADSLKAVPAIFTSTPSGIGIDPSLFEGIHSKSYEDITGKWPSARYDVESSAERPKLRTQKKLTGVPATPFESDWT